MDISGPRAFLIMVRPQYIGPETARKERVRALPNNLNLVPTAGMADLHDGLNNGGLH